MKTISLCALAVGLITTAQAGYIFNWAVDKSVDGSVYDSAYIFARTDSSSAYTQLYAADVTTGQEMSDFSTYTYSQAQSVFPTFASAYSDSIFESYYYQFNKNGTSTGTSSVFTASDSDFFTSVEGMMVAQSYVCNAPEPTSALLMMLGMSLLALKRKVA